MLDGFYHELTTGGFDPQTELLQLYNNTNDEALKLKILTEILRFNNNPVLISEDEGQMGMSLDEAVNVLKDLDVNGLLDNKE